ncbi:MAG: hypothetical protein IKA98_05010 [Candidatus Methanomethylophilaceae archaeon]|nr:hypothetical protein [Candidatus Methanomethylophilaceae archaeon]
MTFYVVDGMDGVGKDTVARMLVQSLESKGRKVSCYKHPAENTVFGRIAARSWLKEGKLQEVIRALSYFMDLFVSSIRKSGDEADDVVFVRYVMSALYLKKPLSRCLFRVVHTLFPKADVGILVDAPAEVAIQRIHSRGEELEVYETAGKLMPLRLDMRYMAEKLSWHILDNRGSYEDTRYELENILYR